MGYDRNATPEEIERSETTRGSNGMPESTEAPAAEGQPGPTNDADPQYGHEEWVSGPRDGWFTATELIDWGYMPEALTPLFGPRIEGPDGIRGWLITHVEHIEATVINRAAELLKSSFQPVRLREMFPVSSEVDLGPSEAEVAAMVENLPPAVTRKVTR